MRFLMRVVSFLHKGIVLMGNGGAILATLALVGVVVVTLIEVVMRGVFGQAFTDTVVLGRVGMVTMSFLVAAYALRQGRHTAITFITDMLPPPLRWRVQALGMVISLITVGTMTVLTFQFAWFTHKVGGLLHSDLYLPAWYFQMLIPIGLGILWLQLIVELAGHIRSRGTLGPPGGALAAGTAQMER